MKFVNIYTVLQDYDGKFWATYRQEMRGFTMTSFSRPPPRSEGPYETQEEAEDMLGYMKRGPAILVREEVVA